MQIDFSPDRWDKLAADWEAWWDHRLARPMVMIEKFAPDERMRSLEQKLKASSLFQLTQNVSIPDVLNHYEHQLECTAFYGDSWPRCVPDFGPGIVAGFIGAKVNVSPETVWFEPPENGLADNSIIAFDDSNPWYQRVMDITMRAVEKWHNTINVGFTDFGGNLDILASMRGTERLLMELYDKPAQVHKWVEQITKVWIEYYNSFFSALSPIQRGFCSWAPLFSTKRTYMLQSDFSYMISPEMFENYVVPDITTCCDVLDHPFYHLDGRGQLPHLRHLLRIEKLRGIQWIPGEGSGNVEDYIDVLKKIKDAGKLCQVYVSAQGAFQIKRMLGGEGFAFKIIEDKMSFDDISRLLTELYKD